MAARRGEALLGRFEHPEAKHVATCFCKQCSSSLPWLTKSGRAVLIPAGTLDQDPGIRPQQNIYWNSHAEWLLAVDELVKYDELPTR